MSKKTKKRNKKFNALTSFRRLASATTHDLAVVWVQGDNKYSSVFNLKNGKREKVTRLMAKALSESTHQWTILLAVFCRRQDGQEYAKYAEVHTGANYYESDLIEAMREHQDALIAQQNPEHFISAGYMAAPHPIEFDEKMAGKIFADMGGWECLAKWEAREQGLLDDEEAA